MSLVSKRLHNLVTTPHAWRIAFSRYFPGPDALNVVAGNHRTAIDSQEIQLSEKRYFARLSALASWRSEYILRTRLLRSLGRGKPAQFQPVGRTSASRHAGGSQSAAVVTYSSGLLYPVSHLHATFGVGLNKKQPMFVHGAVEQGIVTSSDPSLGKINNWGLGDYEAFKHFADLFVGESEWGLGAGEMVGMPNVMDLSQSYGKVYGEACPGGRLFFTSVAEQRGRFLNITSSSVHGFAVPQVTMIGCSVTSVWIAKSESLLKTTNGIFGVLAGFSNGVLAAYALGVNPVHDRRFEKGEATARWVLSPGVPIVAIAVDEKFSYRRHSQKRIWAVVLNALGEVFSLTDVPVRPDFKGKPDSDQIDRLSWDTGRTAEWILVEHTRRRARPDPYDTAAVDGSYTPRTSCYTSGLSKDQIVAETKEIEKFLVYKPKHFQSVCEGWDMRRRLVVDFAGDDRHGAGESILVLECGLDEGKPASIRRLTRRKTKVQSDFDLEPYPAIRPVLPRNSIFGTSAITAVEADFTPSPRSTPRSRTSSHEGNDNSNCRVDWHISTFELGGLKSVEICAVATDDSDFALIATTEDPLLGMSGGSNTSSPLGSPIAQLQSPSAISEIPGHRGRFLAVGTTTGAVLLWDMRSNISPASDVINSVSPVGMIYTESPQISCLALTSLYVVHGGNDGLVQAWDPLASTNQPIRTLNSRFSSRARRRLVQAQASVQGVGNNYYAAGAMVLDPDPTVLRGMVSLGTHLRYWSYSSSSADAYKSSKRRQLNRRSERGSNAAANEQKFSHTGRGALKDYISNEAEELEREQLSRRKEEERLSGRFGVGLLGAGASEEEMLAYATMLSQEAWTSDEMRRDSEENVAVMSKSNETVHIVEEMDPEVAEAIRLSLLEEEQAVPMVHDVPIRYAKKHHPAIRTPKKDMEGSSKDPATLAEENDLDFALQLSLAEEQSKLLDDENFPALISSPSPASSTDDGRKKRKGKGKAKSGAA